MSDKTFYKFTFALNIVLAVIAYVITTSPAAIISNTLIGFLFFALWMESVIQNK